MCTKNHTVPVTLAVMSLLLAFLASTIANAQAPAGPNRPAGVPEDYVITPFGYFHPSCVIHLAEGDISLADGLVIQHADGTSTNIPACQYPHYTARGEMVSADAKREPPTIVHSWIDFAGVTTSTSYGEISATWAVPPAPVYYDSQVIFFFPGLEDINDIVSIVQPVLGWNADFTEAWGIASWNCCPSGTTHESSPVAVSPGDTILGTVKSTCSAGTLSCSKWNITTEDETSARSTTLSNTPSEGQTFNWAFGGALEVYNVSSCYDYPPTVSQSQAFAVTLYDDNFTIISNPAWSCTPGYNCVDGDINVLSGLTPQCNYGGQITATQVTLDYGTAGGTPWSFSTGIPPSNRCYYYLDGGSFSFSLGQTPNSNSLLWQGIVTTNETQVISLDWTLSDNKGTLTQDSYGSGYTGTRNYILTRVPVGTPTLSINASVITLTGCDAEFQENLTGTN
jgi:hypothetical protein